MKFKSQMADVPEADVGQSSPGSVEQNVQFCEDTAPFNYDVSTYVDATRSALDTQQVPLEDFFSRPIPIYQFDWDVAAHYASVIDPWKLFFENKRVINRIANFNLLRANLNIKVVVNGTPFHMGRMLVSYLPSTYNDETLPPGILFANSSDYVRLTQLPHVFLDPTTSTGGDLVLPMFWDKNYMNIPLAEWRNMGSLVFTSINDLAHAMGDSITVHVTVYAWASDVHMSVLTSTNPLGMTSQMGEVEEASKDGVISTKLSALSGFAMALTAVPRIAPYAKATAAVSAGLATIARAFGYSRPSMINEPMPMQRRLIGSSLATTNTPDSSVKLTVDSKQELTIDPRIAGLPGEDTMAISAIAMREAYLTTFIWPLSSMPDTLLWNMRVDPFQIVRHSSAFAEAFLPCAVASAPFKYWTGTMRIRFQVVCSAYHKGRLRLVYDPNSLVGFEHNVNHICVHDIQENNDFTISVAMGQNTSFVQRAPIAIVDSSMRNTAALPPELFGNGVVGVYVANTLVGPTLGTSPLNIEINVYVSFEDDFEVACPVEDFAAYRPYVQPASQMESQMGSYDPTAVKAYSSVNDPVSTPSTLINGKRLQKEHLNEVFFGERITSFRQLIKRYSIYTAHWANVDAAAGVSTIRIHAYSYPYYRGPQYTAIHFGGTYNLSNIVPLQWITLCHQGWRGSIRYKVFNRNMVAKLTDSLHYQVRRNIMNNNYARLASNIINLFSESEAARTCCFNVNQPEGSSLGLSGPSGPGFVGQAISGVLERVLEFEVPFYTNTRFANAKRLNWTLGLGGTPLPGYDLVMTQQDDPYSTHVVMIAAGEDFQNFFWTGMPYMVYDPIIPLS